MDKLVKHHCNIRAREMMIAYETSTVAKTLFAFVLITLFAGIKGCFSDCCQDRMFDCRRYQEFGHTTSGVYQLTPLNMITTDGGGWMVFQRRVDGSVDFHRGWDDYVQLFGDIRHEHWLDGTVMRRRRIRKLWPFVLLVIIALIDIYLLIEEKKSNDSALSTLIANVVYFNRPNQERRGEKYGLKLSTLERTKRTRFTKMKFGSVYVFGAAMGNSSETAAWDFIKVYSSVNQSFSNSTFSCCVKYSKSSGSDIYRQPVLTYNIPNEETELSAYHHACFNPKPGTIPNGITITTDSYTCGEEHVTYRKPLVPLLEAETKLAFCTKAAYGNRSAELIIEWMETHKYLGIDKVVTYYMKDINPAARKVLEYYATTGLLDLYYFEPAEEDQVRRRFHPPDRQSANDKQLLVFDSFERMSGYTYFGIIDHDEFLIPTKGRSLKTYLADLFRQYNATTTGFKFRTQHFYLNLGQQGTQNDLILGRYITRPDHSTGFYGPKNIYKPKYVKDGKIHTHAVIPRPGFKMVDLPAREGFIRHYRECYLKDCEGGHKRVNDTWAAKWSQRIEGSVRRVRKLLFGTESAII